VDQDCAFTLGTMKRTPLKRRGPKLQKKWPEYEASVQEWREQRELIDDFQCQVISISTMERCRKRAGARPHHKAGRLGANLCDKTKFLAVCGHHHRWIHDNPRIAENFGYIIREYDQH